MAGANGIKVQRKKGRIEKIIDRINNPVKKYGDCDFVFLVTVISLLAIGIIMMFSASYAWAIKDGHNGSFYATRQAFYACLGLLGMLFFTKFDYQKYKIAGIAVIAYCIPLLLLFLVLVIGETDGGATRWIQIGGFQIQPSELMKVGIVITFAYLIEKNYDRMNTFKWGIIPFAIMMAFVALLLMAEPHLSATIIICFLCYTLLFIGGTKFWHRWILLLVGVVGLAGLVLYKLFVSGFDYYIVRWKTWVDPFSDVQGDTWQTCMSLIAIGSGGFFGTGLGESRQKYLYLPESKNDFVFSIVCEELGFVGAMTVILLFLLLIFRGLYIAKKAPDKFGMLVAVGFTSHIGLQAFLNIAVVSGFIPNTGISLPFFSYGGTALILQLCEMGVVLNISKSRKKIKPKVEDNSSNTNKIEYTDDTPELDA